MDLFDVDSFNYRNRLLTTDGFDDRTIEWGTGSDWQVIPKKLLQFIFRLYNVSRQKIQMTYQSSALFWPLHRFVDSKQSNKTFVLGSDTFYPDKDEHEVELLEWDGTTTINLI